MKNDTQLVLADKETAVQRQSLGVENFESLARYAIEKGVPLESIVAVRRELKAEADKAAFDSALAAFQAECPKVMKSSAVSDATGRLLYKFASFESIVDAVAPLMKKHGFSYQLDTDTTSQDGWVIAECHLTHCQGHCRTSRAKFPIGAGTRAMSTTQIYASALSFASRRVFCNAFGIVPVGEDNEMLGNKPKPQGPSTQAPPDLGTRQIAQDLWSLLKPVRGQERDWKKANAWMWDNAVLSDTEAAPELSKERFKEAIEAAKKILENT